MSEGCAAYSADDVSSLYLTFVRGSRVGESVHIGPVITSQGSIALTDIALSPSGALWGIDDTSAFYRIDPVSAAATYIGRVGTVVNGLVVGSDRTIYASGFQSLYTINPATGAGTRVGGNTGFGSEGDLAFSSNGVLYMSATGNALVRLNTRNGVGTEIGEIGYSNVYGLGFIFDTLYGETSNSELITIDPATGKGTLVVSNDGVASNGMAVPTAGSTEAARWLSPVGTALGDAASGFLVDTKHDRERNHNGRRSRLHHVSGADLQRHARRELCGDSGDVAPARVAIMAKAAPRRGQSAATVC